MPSGDLTISATDGFPLAATLYTPSVDSPDRLVIIGSATGVKQGYYGPFARFLAQQGLGALTFDYRGVGQSRPDSLRGFRAFMHEWGAKDLAGVIAWAQQQHAPARLMIVGHSAGGQMVGLAANNQALAALVMVASQNGYWRLWDFPRRYYWALFWYAIGPLLTRLYGYTPTRRLRFGEDLPAGVGLEWARWCRSPHFIVDRQGRPLREHFRAFSAPILAYSFSDDILAPRRAVASLLDFYGSPDKTHHHISPAQLGLAAIGHFGFFRERFPPSLWRQTSDWLQQS